MTQQKNTLRKALFITVVIVLIILLGAVSLGAYVKVSKDDCSQRSLKVASSNDRARAEIYDQCLTEKNLGGF